jgi:hypothetical protein
MEAVVAQIVVVVMVVVVVAEATAFVLPPPVRLPGRRQDHASRSAVNCVFVRSGEG